MPTPMDLAYLIPANILQPLIDIANEILVFLHDLGLEYGAAIVALTFITRAAILPLSVKQIRSMRAMSALQPQVKEIQERYKDDRQRMQREMMQIYQENDVNPFASCLPLLLQLPVFISLFYLLQGDEFKDEVRAAGEQSWMFIDNLTEKATGSELIILLALYIGTSIIAGLIMTGRNASNQQRMIALGLPLIFTPIMIGFPAGPARLLDLDQRLDDGPAGRGQALLPGGRAADPRGDRGEDGGRGPGQAPAAAPAQEETPKVGCPSWQRELNLPRPAFRRSRPSASRRCWSASSPSSDSTPTSRSPRTTTRFAAASRARRWAC